jgi:hypothetical protein
MVQVQPRRKRVSNQDEQVLGRRPESVVDLNKKSFKLPRVEKEKFILLLRLGLEYNRETGTYSIGSYNNIEKLSDTLASILNTEKVTFLQNCSLCGKDFPCIDCKYYDLCATKNLPFHCVCPQCLSEDKPYEEHAQQQKQPKTTRP